MWVGRSTFWAERCDSNHGRPASRESDALPTELPSNLKQLVKRAIKKPLVFTLFLFSDLLQAVAAQTTTNIVPTTAPKGQGCLFPPSTQHYHNKREKKIPHTTLFDTDSNSRLNHWTDKEIQNEIQYILFLAAIPQRSSIETR